MTTAEVSTKIIHPGTSVRLLDGDTREVNWSGSLDAFFASNDFDEAVKDVICTALLLEGKFVVGGGAERLFVLEVDGRFALVVIGRDDHQTRRFDSMEHAALAAGLVCSNAPLRFAAVITDLNTSEVIWQYAPPTFQGHSIRSAA